ncbi:hypothetical protein [Actinocorallia longicatena]|uniref:Uncharacterized protein n=1 Tax=Actinocorallia longicatena TaxID=111803 RepID=A0ABP6Q689_9ACTN
MNWDVMRQDDNGNQVRVASHQTRVSALSHVLVFESGVQHKQTYWVDGPDDPQLTTNRDLYLTVLKIGRDARAASWSLSAFLRSMWKVSSGLRARPHLTLDDVGALFSAAGSTPPPSYDEAWTTKDLDLTGAPRSYADWERVLLSQIADLEDFVARPPVRDDGDGVQAPRPEGTGRRATPALWRNFDSAAFVECAIAGAFGGWSASDGARLPKDDGPRQSPVRDIPEIPWLELARMLVCGQNYA